MMSNPSTPYRRGSRLPTDVEAYREYMREYMIRWRRGQCGNKGNTLKSKHDYLERRRRRRKI